MSGSAPIGGYQHPEGDIELNAGRPVTVIEVTSLGDRPVQVGSHLHFAEANRCLRFDRLAAYGQRLDIPAGTAVRFEPGDTRQVSLVPFTGGRVWTGGPQVVIRYYEAQPPDGDKVPICAVARASKGQLRKLPGSKPGTALLEFSGAGVYIVDEYR